MQLRGVPAVLLAIGLRLRLDAPRTRPEVAVLYPRLPAESVVVAHHMSGYIPREEIPGGTPLICWGAGSLQAVRYLADEANPARTRTTK